MNTSLFLAINAGPHPPSLLLALARLLAVWAVPGGVALFLTLWIRGTPQHRGSLITATLTMVFGLAVNFAIGLVYFHPRPFMLGLGHQYLSHPPDNSFPSDHATFLWSLGFALLALGGFPVSAGLLLAAGLAVAWARIYLGVHFPFDMLGSFVVSLLVTRAARPLDRPVRRWLLPPSLTIYETMLAAAHLPPALFPRAPRR
ncbi:MAG: undecaprenyl-diphosphatase [Rhodospirillales bacterium]|nr:undecaprenyl-diphosphatase [Rhodospirillales bacterium]